MSGDGSDPEPPIQPWTPPGNLREHIERVVTEAVQDGLIAIDEESGLAALAAVPPVEHEAECAERPAGQDTLTAVLEYERERQHRETLQTALSTGPGQLAALRALGGELQKVGITERVFAERLRDQLAVVAEGQAPPSLLDQLRPMLNLHAEQRSGARGVELWFETLVYVFRFQILGRSPREAVEHVLGWLCDGTKVGVPEAFIRRDERHVRKADEFMRGLRVQDAQRWSNQEQERWPEHKPKRRGRGLTAWEAARKFADCFDVNVAREHDAKRAPKTQRKPLRPTAERVRK